MSPKTASGEQLELDFSGLALSTNRFYERHAAEYFERTVSADMSPLRNRFLASMPEGGRILDAGCGSGRDLAVFIRQGYRAVGIDASPALVELARTYSGAPCTVGRFEEITYVSCFDGIWACASLLHTPKSMLMPVLLRLHRSLAPEGLLFASVQQGEGEGLIPDGRFFAYYEMREFRDVVERAGFIIEDGFCTDGVLPGRATRWINVLARRDNPSPQSFTEKTK